MCQKLKTTILFLFCCTGLFAQHQSYQSFVKNYLKRQNKNGEPIIKLSKQLFYNIAINDRGNYLLRPPAIDTPLIYVLLTGLKSGSLKAYDSDNDTLLLQSDKLSLIHSDSASDFNADSIAEFRIKEEWKFSKPIGRLTIRIVCLAPIVRIKSAKGIEQQQAAFWLHYQDIRRYLWMWPVNSNNSNIRNLQDVFDSKYYTIKEISDKE